MKIPAVMSPYQDSGFKPVTDNLLNKTHYRPPIKCSLFPQFGLDAEKLRSCKYQYAHDPERLKYIIHTASKFKQMYMLCAYLCNQMLFMITKLRIDLKRLKKSLLENEPIKQKVRRPHKSNNSEGYCN